MATREFRGADSMLGIGDHVEVSSVSDISVGSTRTGTVWRLPRSPHLMQTDALLQRVLINKSMCV